MDVVIVRHGETDGTLERRYRDWDALPLCERGRAQALAVGKCLAAELASSVVYASDLPRAHQTAELIVGATATPIRLTHELRELRVGVFAGLTRPEAAARYPEAYAGLRGGALDARAPEGESFREGIARMSAFLATVRASGADHVVIVSHRAMISLLLNTILFKNAIPDPLGAWFETDPCALHWIRYEENGRPYVLALNARGHLTTDT